MNLRLCMIGCGAFAHQFHGPAQQRCAAGMPELERTGCCDSSPERAHRYATAFGFARVYTDWREMLAIEHPDAVVMAVPPDATATVAAAVLELGFPLLLEKPPGKDLDELARLRAAAAHGGGFVQVGFNRRYMPVMRRAREILEANFGDGAPLSIDYEMARCDRWNEDFSTTAVHAIDAVRVLSGRPFETATLEFQPVQSGERRSVNATLDLESAPNRRARISVRPVAGLNRETAVVHATGRTLELTIPFPTGPGDVGRLQYWKGNECTASYADSTASEALERMGLYDETRAFLHAVHTRQPPEPGLDQCAQQVELMALLRRGEAGRFELASR